MVKHKNAFIEMVIQHTFPVLFSPPKITVFKPDYLSFGATEVGLITKNMSLATSPYLQHSTAPHTTNHVAKQSPLRICYS